MLIVESLDQLVQQRPRYLACRQRYGQFLALSGVANVGEPRQPATGQRHLVTSQLRTRIGLERSEQRCHPPHINVRRALHGCDREIVLEVSREQSDSAEDAGIARDHAAVRAEQPHQARTMYWPRTTERAKCEIGRSQAALDRHDLQRADHVVVDDVDDAGCRLFE